MLRRGDRPNLSSNYVIETAAWLAAATLLMTLTGAFWIYYESKIILSEQQEQARSQLAQGIGIAMTEGLAVKDFGLLESRLVQALSNPSLESALVVDPNGLALARVELNDKGLPEPVFDTKSIDLPEITKSARAFEELGNDGRVIAWQPISAGSLLGWLSLQFAYDETELILAELGRKAFFLTLTITLVMLALFGLILRRAHGVIIQNEIQLRRANQSLKDAAEHDPLTRLPNRAALMNMLQTWLDEASRQKLGMAVVFLDLDGFKPLNDSHGHRFGDKVLVWVAKALKQATRQEDFIARYGGDEFVILVHEVSNMDEIEPLLRRVLNRLTSRFEIDGIEAGLGSSLGVAVYPLHGRSPNELLIKADQAMYEAKTAGGNQWAVWTR
ncbi:MAG: diguanylate cyclase domain-containing protein [Burkholderiaceae bacterium]